MGLNWPDTSSEIRRVFAPVLVACVREACLPRPDELLEVTERIRREAFPTAAIADGWRRAWCVACTAIGGASEYLNRAPMLTKDTIMTYQISLTTSDAGGLAVEVHASATAALLHLYEKRKTGSEVTIMGPDGEKLELYELQVLSAAENDRTSAVD